MWSLFGNAIGSWIWWRCDHSCLFAWMWARWIFLCTCEGKYNVINNSHYLDVFFLPLEGSSKKSTVNRTDKLLVLPGYYLWQLSQFRANNFPTDAFNKYPVSVKFSRTPVANFSQFIQKRSNLEKVLGPLGVSIWPLLKHSFIMLEYIRYTLSCQRQLHYSV